MAQEAFYIFGSVVGVSLIALVGLASLSLKHDALHRILFVLVSFAAGALFGGAFIHLIPRTVNLAGFTHTTGLYLVSGVVLFFIIEKYIHWHHHHFREDICEDCVQPVSYMVLIGDGVHNLIDGIVIAAAYMASVPTGVATTVAVALHEIPQEIGDFAVLVHGGFSVRRALLFNFLSALTAVVGAGLVLVLRGQGVDLVQYLLPLAAGGFVYIAGSDLLPEIKEEKDARRSSLQMLAFVLGIGVMYGLTLL